MHHTQDEVGRPARTNSPARVTATRSAPPLRPSRPIPGRWIAIGRTRAVTLPPPSCPTLAGPSSTTGVKQRVSRRPL
jgi:hypothetical protein